MKINPFVCLWALPRASSASLRPSPLLAHARRHSHPARSPAQSESTRYGVRQAIYLAMRDVFTGGPAQLSKSRDVRRLIKLNLRRGEVCDLVDMYGLGFVTDMTRVMLHQRIFASLHRAKAHLPDLFGLIKTPEEIKGAGPYAAMQTKAALEHQLNSLTLARGGSFTASDTNPEVPISAISGDMERIKNRDSYFPPREKTLPHFPTKLPFAAQHGILRQLQKILEAVCFEHGMREMPRVMKLRRWDCPEAAELHEMVEAFMSKDGHYLETGRVTAPLEDLLQSVSLIRHAAVHRIPMTVAQASKFFGDAESLALMLGDRVRAAAIARLAGAAEPVMDDMMRQVRASRSRLVQTLDEYSARRDELWREEEEAIEKLALEHDACRQEAGRRIQEIFTAAAAGGGDSSAGAATETS